MQPTIWTVLIVAAMLLNTAVSRSQTRGPSTLRAAVNATDGAEIDTLYSQREQIVRAFNWGGSLNGVNADLRMNTWHVKYPFSSNPPTDTLPQRDIRRILPGGRLALVPSWDIPDTMYKNTTPGVSQFPWFTNAYIADRIPNPPRPWLTLDLGHGSTSSLTEAQGMRFEPELEFTDTNAFVPRSGDRQRGVWGFLKRDHGTTSSDTTNTNFSRFMLSAASVSGWDTVLTNSWPQQEFCEWQKNVQFEQMRSFNGHLMYLGVNLRRTDTTDTDMDSTPILRLHVHYQLADGSVGLIRFDSLPQPNVNTANVSLPVTLDGHGRGLVRPLIARPSGVVTDMVITRGMLPRGDAADSLRDVTVSGHVRLVPEQIHGTELEARNFYLRNRQRLGLPIVLKAEEDSGRIIRLWIDVEYNGQSDIAIDWVQLGTENFTWFTQGHHDPVVLQGYREMADGLTTWNTTQMTNPGDSIRIWKWYNRDEGPAAYWNGMRYMHELFDNRTTTELGLLDERPWWVDRYLYATGITTVWEGHSARITNEGIAPYYLHGNSGVEDRGKPSYYHRFGRHSELYPHRDTVDYDLNFNNPDTSQSQRLPIASMTTPPTDTWYYPLGTRTPQSGVQTMIEHNRYLQSRDASYLFRDDLEWMPNLWLSADYTTIIDTSAGHADSIFVNPRSQIRHLTGEEVRLLSWSELILGAKGLVYYWGANPDSITTSQQISLPGDGNFQSYGFAYGPANSPVRTPADVITRTVQLASYGARDARVGGDWLDNTNSTGLWQILNANQVPLDAALAFLNTAVAPGQYYLGWLSMRSALQSVHDVIAAGENDLDSLHLKAWYHRGFRTWSKGDTPLLEYPVNADSVRTRHPLRDSVTKSWTWEAPDSSFVELTVLQDGATPMDQRFVVGVLNRRASPLLYDTTFIALVDTHHVRLDTFVTYQEQFEAIAADSAKTSRYRQAGARVVEIPFRYRHPDGHWRNLRVEAIGVVTDTSQGIVAMDTVIGQDTKLRLTLMPGEGVMLKVTPLQAHTNDAEFGYLDHSNQRKMVAYPKIDTVLPYTDDVDDRTYLRQVNGDTMWYHRVYHRRRSDSGTILLSVYYQRSQALVMADSPTTPDVNTFDASTISWEAPILVSDAVILRVNGDSVATEDFSCGYPSIVVRFDTSEHDLKAKAYVVFACEYDKTENFEKVLIAEAVLPAQATRTEQVNYLAAHHAEGLEVVAAPDAPMLKHWGTPMVNASSDGNYYCWSHGMQGIGVGFKTPDARVFAAGQIDYIAFGNAAEIKQAHPSMNSYSRLHIGENDAGLVWQAGPEPDYGTNILYTRLTHTAGGAIGHELTASASRHVIGPPILTVDPDVAILSDAAVVVDSVERMVYHRMPALYRHLSDWELVDTAQRYTLRMVNHKAERAVWETDIRFYNEPTMIGRRVFDISLWSATTTSIDTIWSQADHYLFSEDLNLRGPDIAQGEQAGDAESDPPLQQNWEEHNDSTMVIEFFSDTTDNDPLSQMWSLTGGYTSFYGQDQDHDHADLVADGRLRPISGNGRYPHLAARYSMLANAGWQRNRRIYDRPGGVWDGGYSSAPGLSTSSQYFYKEGLDGPKIHGFVYRGVRGRNGAALLGPVWIESAQKWVAATEADAPPKSARGTVATPWLTLEAVDDIALMTKAWSDDDMVGELYVERRSDGLRLNANAIARNQDNKVNRRAHTLLTDPGDAYRFILVPSDDETWPVEDIEIAHERTLRFAKQGARSILDLRSMEQRAASGELSVYPNPAGDRLTIVVNLQDVDSQRNAMVRLTTMDGRLVLEHSCLITDVLHLDVNSVAAGIYVLSVDGNGGTTITQKVSIVR